MKKNNRRSGFKCTECGVMYDTGSSIADPVSMICESCAWSDMDETLEAIRQKKTDFRNEDGELDFSEDGITYGIDLQEISSSEVEVYGFQGEYLGHIELKTNSDHEFFCASEGGMTPWILLSIASSMKNRLTEGS